MKITLEGTDEQPTVASVSVPHDDLTITQVWDGLIKPVLLAYGFSNETVDDLMIHPQTWEESKKIMEEEQ